MADDHTLGRGGGPGGVLEEGRRIVVRRRRVPRSFGGRSEAVGGNQPDGRGPRADEKLTDRRKRLRIAQGNRGLRVLQDRAKSRNGLFRASAFRRKGGHRDDPCIETPEERADEIKLRRNEEYGALAGRRHSLECRSDPARSEVQFPVSERSLLDFAAAQKRERASVRMPHGPTAKKRDETPALFNGRDYLLHRAAKGHSPGVPDCRAAASIWRLRLRGRMSVHTPVI